VYGELGKTADTNRVLGVPQKGNIRFVWLPGAGHYLPHEAPGAVAEIVGSLRVFGSSLA
jgi:pimeloyl-ACP methyl ester carboxylesterase